MTSVTIFFCRLSSRELNEANNHIINTTTLTSRNAPYPFWYLRHGCRRWHLRLILISRWNLSCFTVVSQNCNCICRLFRKRVEQHTQRQWLSLHLSQASIIFTPIPPQFDWYHRSSAWRLIWLCSCSSSASDFMVLVVIYILFVYMAIGIIGRVPEDFWSFGPILPPMISWY